MGWRVVMRAVCLLILAIFVMMSFPAQADDVNRDDYQSEILDLLNQYGVDFDNCFPELPSDFPSLPDNFSELDDRVNELDLNKWYHRKITYLFTEIDEIFFTFKTDMSYFAIRVAYLYNEEESKFIIYAVHFYETMEGVDSELGHIETLPYGVTDKSIEEIDACMGTPGFMLISIIIALLIVVAGKRLHKKR
jgi:hypothetical protein